MPGTNLGIEQVKSPKPMIPVSTFWDVTGSYVEKGNWYIEGYCTSFSADQEGDFVTKSAAQSAVPQLIGMTLLHNHDPDREIGVCVSAKVDDLGIWVKCKISKTEPNIWEKIQEQILNKFSIRFLELAATPKFDRTTRKTINYVDQMAMRELSLTSLPCNLGALVSHSYVAKSIGTEDHLMKDLMSRLTAEVKSLIQDFREGKLLLDPAEAPVGEVKTQDPPNPGETKTIPAVTDPPAVKEKADPVPGSPCPFYQTAECPVTADSIEAPADQAIAVQSCKFSKVYACQYLNPAEEAKTVKPDEAAKTADPPAAVDLSSYDERLKAMEASLESLKTGIGTLVERVADQVLETILGQMEGVKTSMSALEARIGTTDESVASVKSIVEADSAKYKSLEALVPLSKQVEEHADPEKVKTKSFWGGTFPV